MLPKKIPCHSSWMPSSQWSALPGVGLCEYIVTEGATTLRFLWSASHQPMVHLQGQKGLDITRHQMDRSMDKGVYGGSNVILLEKWEIYFTNLKSIPRLVS